jgi:hypothetical protein
MAQNLKSDLTTGIDKKQVAKNNAKPISSPIVTNPSTNIPSAPKSDNNGLPYTMVPNNKDASLKRNIIHWFIPNFGVVRMYINPQSINYMNKKLITKDRTKGGYSLQYWGEDLTEISIDGHTGSSGIEGINVLEEIYRAEQIGFDSIGLTLAANNASADISNNLVNGIGGYLGNTANSIVGLTGSSTAAAGGAGVLGTLVGLNSPNNNLSSVNIPTLAQSAFTVEMYYGGWVYRGFFSDMTIKEQATDFLINYSIKFFATQKRGYRLNYFPWSRSAKDGPSAYETPQSFSGYVKTE